MAKHPDYPGVSSFADRHGKIRWRFRKTGSPDISIPGEPHTDAFNAVYQDAVEGRIPVKSLNTLRMRALKERPAARKIERLLASIQMRASRLNREFQIDQDWLLDRLREQDFKCAITGIPFSTDYLERDPHCISIDRIDNRRGYTPDNVRVVTLHVNYALNSFGLEQFDALCLARINKKFSELQNA